MLEIISVTLISNSASTEIALEISEDKSASNEIVASFNALSCSLLTDSNLTTTASLLAISEDNSEAIEASAAALSTNSMLHYLQN